VGKWEIKRPHSPGEDRFSPFLPRQGCRAAPCMARANVWQGQDTEGSGLVHAAASMLSQRGHLCPGTRARRDPSALRSLRVLVCREQPRNGVWSPSTPSQPRVKWTLQPNSLLGWRRISDSAARALLWTPRAVGGPSLKLAAPAQRRHTGPMGAQISRRPSMQYGEYLKSSTLSCNSLVSKDELWVKNMG